MRLDQRLSQALALSRSEAKKHIKAGLVSVDGVVYYQTGLQVTDAQTVLCQNQPADILPEQYILLHKPAGYVCSHIDDGHPSALRLLERNSKKLHFAGRLDADTTGLVLLSSDGQWCHRVSSPNSKKQKHYRVTLAEPLTCQAMQQLQQGVHLHGEKRATAPCQIDLIDDFACNIMLSEGKYHQVRRMFAAVGNHVTALHRFRIGQLQLEPLAEGASRPLSPEEIQSF